MAAGLAAQMAPHLLQQTAEAARARADEADLQRIMRMGLGPLDTGDDEALWVCACVRLQCLLRAQGRPREACPNASSTLLRRLWCIHQIRQQPVSGSPLIMGMMMTYSKVHAWRPPATLMTACR